MLEELNELNPKPRNTAELKMVLQAIWNGLRDEKSTNLVSAFAKSQGRHLNILLINFLASGIFISKVRSFFQRWMFMSSEKS